MTKIPTAFLVVWLLGAAAFVGFWGFVLYLAYTLVMHLTGAS